MASGLYYAPIEPDTSFGNTRFPDGAAEATGLTNLGATSDVTSNAYGFAVGGSGSGLNAGDVFGTMQQVIQGTAALTPSLPPAAPAAPAGGTAFYSPSTGKMFAGGLAFDQRDVQSAFRAAQQFTAAVGARPPSDVPDWQPISRTAFESYLTELRTPRGAGELFLRGVRNVAGGLVGGVGALTEFAGAENVGRAIQGFGETITGQDEFDRQRSALIQQSNSLASNIFDAAIESTPTVLFSLLGAGAGAVAGGALGAARAGALAARTGTAAAPYSILGASPATVGGAVGAAALNFPQTVNSFYEAAQNARTPDGRPAYDLNDFSTRATVLGAATVSSLLEAIAPGKIAGSLSKALRDRLEQAATDSVSGIARAKAVGGAAAGASFTEAATEALQTVMEQAVFDPEFRRQLSAQDWKALGPYMVDKYGENTLIAAGAGAILGAGFGGAGKFIGTRPRDVLNTGTGGEQPGTGGEQFGPPRPGGEAGFRVGSEQFGPTLPVSSDLGPVVEPGGLRSAEGVGFPVWNEQLGAYILPTPPAAAPQQGPFLPGFRTGPEQFGPTLPSLEGAVTALPPITGPQFGPTRIPPTMPAPQVFPTRPTLAPETFVTPGMERLRRPIPAPAAPTTMAETPAGNQLLALRRQLELQQAQAQRAAQPQPLAPTAAERDYEAALAQAAIQQPVSLNPDSVMTTNNRGLNNARRNLVERFNGLSQTDQDNFLTRYGNDPLALEDAIRGMTIGQVRETQAEINRMAETPRPPLRRPAPPAPAPAPAPIPAALAPLTAAPAPAPTPTVQEGPTNAPEVRQVEQGGVSQRAGTGGPVPGQGQDRNVTPQKQGGGGKAGSSNLTQQGRAQQTVVATLEAEGITLTTKQKADLNRAESKIKRYQALLSCLRN